MKGKEEIWKQFRQAQDIRFKLLSNVKPLFPKLILHFFSVITFNNFRVKNLSVAVSGSSPEAPRAVAWSSCMSLAFIHVSLTCVPPQEHPGASPICDCSVSQPHGLQVRVSGPHQNAGELPNYSLSTLSWLPRQSANRQLVHRPVLELYWCGWSLSTLFLHIWWKKQTLLCLSKSFPGYMRLLRVLVCSLVLHRCLIIQFCIVL